MGYQTKQHAAILQVLQGATGHLTAMEICDRLRDAGQPVGSATVYRHLDRLVENGAVRKYIIEEGKGACYQYVGDHADCAQHYHLKCAVCGRLLHVECAYLDKVAAHILEHHGFQLENEKTVFYGVCRDCRQEDRV